MGVEDGDAGAGNVGEALEGCLAGVAARRGDDHDAATVTLAGDTHELREHLEGDVLEGARRAVPQLERIQAVADLDGLARLAAKGSAVGAGEQALERRRALGDVIANEQASVWGDTLENCLLTC